MRNGRKTTVRLISGCTAILVILIYGVYTERHGSSAHHYPGIHHRHLLSIQDDADDIQRVCRGEQQGSDQANVNCTDPLYHGNDTCQFISDNCGSDVQLFDYLSLIACHMPNVKVCPFSFNLVCTTFFNSH